MPPVCGLTTGGACGRPSWGDESRARIQAGGGRGSSARPEWPAAIWGSGAGPGRDAQLGGQLAEEHLPRSPVHLAQEESFHGCARLETASSRLEDEVPPPPPVSGRRGADMETEAEMSPRGQDSGVAAAAGSPERDMGWPLRDGLRDGPPCPGSGLPSEARRGRVHRSEPPRLWRSVTQPTTPGLGVRVVPAQGAGRSGEPRGGGSQQSRPPAM